MKILVLGSGAREHALCYGLQKEELYCVPGNPGIGELATLCEGDILNPEEMVNLAKELDVDLVVIGPEAPLEKGVSDALRIAGFSVFGPSKEAARLETSKAFAKDFMKKYDIPTADYVLCEDLETFNRYQDKNYVVKADGLCGGKGVFIPKDREEYLAIGESLFKDKSLGDSANKVVLEEFLEGPECSFFYLVNDRSYTYLGDAKDHKKAFEGETGPNTGGMGAISPVVDLTEREMTQMHEIMEKVYRGLKEEQLSFQGVLFIGVIRTKEGLKLLEFNVRFGDPETQSLLLRVESELSEHLLEVAENKPLSAPRLTEDVAVGVVVASAGYPEKPETGYPIILGDLQGVTLFHGGTKKEGEKLLNSGGRIFTLVALQDDVLKASKMVYKEIEKIAFKGSRFRKDIQ